jgi:hypothetical protein
LTAEAFRRWLKVMKDRGIITLDMEAALLLGISPNSIVTLKQKGANRRTALACNALLNHLPPYN